MKTEIIKIDPDHINSLNIKRAAEKIMEGGLVAFPTETVYGLGADALNPRACARIFEAKRRPLEDPLIVHIAWKEELFKLTGEVPEIVSRLTDKFWPGPLTLILKKSKNIPDIVTAGLDTVAIRMPAHKIALCLIKESQTAIAAPSANLFSRPSPTCSQHVREDLDGRIDLIIDGGKTSLGLESTILDLTQNPPSILRPGGVSRERLAEIMGEVRFYKPAKILSPGMYLHHYSPRAKVMLVEGEGRFQVEEVHNLSSRLNSPNHRLGIIAKEENKDEYGEFKVKSLGRGDDLITCAANLFSLLREFDREGIDTIIVEAVEERGLGLAIMDRLRKAAGARMSTKS